MTDRIYYSQNAKEKARRERLVIAGLAAAAGLVAGTVAALIWGSERLSGEQVDQFLQQGGEQARKAAEEFLENAVKVTSGVKEKVEHVTGS